MTTCSSPVFGTRQPWLQWNNWRVFLQRELAWGEVPLLYLWKFMKRTDNGFFLQNTNWLQPRCHLKTALAPIEEGISYEIFTRRMPSSEATHQVSAKVSTSTTPTTSTTTTSSTSTTTTSTLSISLKQARRSEPPAAAPRSSQTGEIVAVVGLSVVLLALLLTAVSLTVILCRRFLSHTAHLSSKKSQNFCEFFPKKLPFMLTLSAL